LVSDCLLLQIYSKIGLGTRGGRWYLYFVVNNRDRPIYRFADIFGRYRYIGIGKLDMGIGLSVSTYRYRYRIIGIGIGYRLRKYQLYWYRLNMG
jgi:hypothetical protein